MKLLSQGAKANLTGKDLEQKVEAILRSAGLEILTFKEWQKLGTDNVVIKNFPYTSIYNEQTTSKMEFFVYSSWLNLAARIECKTQTVAGTADEKFPFLLDNIFLAQDHPDTTIVILEGNGMRRKAKEHIRDYSNKNLPLRNLIYIDGVNQFKHFVNYRKLKTVCK